MANSDLTDRQQQVLDYLDRYIENKGYSPSYREIALAIGVRSTNAVNDHLQALEQKGYIKKEPNIARNLRVVRKTDK